MQRIAATSLLHFFNGEKSEFLLGRDVAPNPHVTFERSKVTKTLSEGFRSPQTPANVSCRELFKYKLLSTDFYVGARSEVSWTTFELTAEKIIILCFTENA